MVGLGEDACRPRRSRYRLHRCVERFDIDAIFVEDQSLCDSYLGWKLRKEAVVYEKDTELLRIDEDLLPACWLLAKGTQEKRPFRRSRIRIRFPRRR